MVVPAGMIFGAFIIGWISDDFGRKAGFVTSSTIYMISAAIPFIIQTYWALCLSRFTMGIANSGCYYSGLTLCVEVSSLRMRSTVGTLYNVSYSVGAMILPLMAYFLPKWRDLLIAYSVPTYLLFISIWLIPESPRWLATKGKYEKAWKILKKVWKDVDVDVADDDTPIQPQSKKERLKKSCQVIGNFCLIKELLHRLIICLVLWFIINLNYDLLPQNADNFGVNRYLMNGLLGLMEGVSYVIPVVLLRFFARRILGASLFICSGVALMLTLAVPRDETWAQPLQITLIMLGRVANCTLYAVVIVHTAELFPTEERATALGFSAGAIKPQLPAGLCGIANIGIAVVVLILPETRGKPLVDTVEEIEALTEESEKVSCLNICKLKM
ncbi:Organic cation transporter protein [Gryllus bimaculatus]|nr:Organic cation transporter protein [Gryllus bimaculatus]